MALQLLSHGEPNWDVKVNAIIDELTKTEDSVENMVWTIGKDGIVIINDLFQLNDYSFYEYMDIGDRRIVHLYISLTATRDFTGSATGYAFTVPDSVKPSSPMNGSAGQYYSWNYDGKFGFLSYLGNSTVSIKANDILTVDKVVTKSKE